MYFSITGSTFVSGGRMITWFLIVDSVGLSLLLPSINSSILLRRSLYMMNLLDLLDNFISVIYFHRLSAPS